MVGPQHLLTISRRNAFERLPARMRGGKRRMATRMPVLGQHHIAESRGHPVDDRHHLVAARYGERAAGAKIVLHVHHDEDVVVAERRGLVGAHGLGCCMRQSTSAASVLSSSATSTG